MKRLTCLFLKVFSSSWEQTQSQRSLQLTRENSRLEDSGFFMNGSPAKGFRLKIFQPECATCRFLTLKSISLGRRGNHLAIKLPTTFLAIGSSVLLSAKQMCCKRSSRQHSQFRSSRSWAEPVRKSGVVQPAFCFLPTAALRLQLRESDQPGTGSNAGHWSFSRQGASLSLSLRNH